MSEDGRSHTNKLCGAVNPSEMQQGLYSASWQGINFELRMIYIADDDLGFVNQCTHHYDEYTANMHREPYHSVAVSNSGQTFIISMEQQPVCVAEVHHALQYYAGEEIVPKKGDHFLRLFFAENIPMPSRSAVLHFLAEYCGGFEEVGDLIIRPENLDEAALIDAGFAAHKDAGGKKTGVYFYSTSKEKV